MVVLSFLAEYILDGDITADGTAIAIRASKVVLNLNGNTVTYNQTVPGDGVTIDTYNKSDIAIINGKIIQGVAMSEGDVYGKGNNPIRTLGTSRLQIANINARYGGRDVNGFLLKYAGHSVVEGCTLEDTWNIGTPKNRHQGKTAIGIGNNAIVRNNTIINARQAGIGAGDDSEIYGNTVSVNSMSTNSSGIGGYKAKNVKVYNNTIIARGEHPLGISYVSAGTDNIEIYNNTIDVQTTKLGDEYGGRPACLNPATPCGNYAVGFRTTWGGNNINFHDNTIIVRTDSTYKGTQSATGKPVVVNGKGRGLMVAIHAGEKSQFNNNKITVLDKDGSGKAFGIACTGYNVGDMTFAENIVTSNVLNVALGDEYGACGNHPLFIRNTFIKADNFPAYRTIASEFGGYFEGTGRFVSNIYKDGASKNNININAAGKGRQSVYFGREISSVLSETTTAKRIKGAAVTLQNGGAPFDSTSTTDAEGRAKLIVYDYELHDENSTNTETLTHKLAPHTIQTIIGTNTFSTVADSSASAWDALTSAGTHSLGLYLDGVLDTSKKLTLSY